MTISDLLEEVLLGIESPKRNELRAAVADLEEKVEKLTIFLEQTELEPACEERDYESARACVHLKRAEYAEAAVERLQQERDEALLDAADFQEALRDLEPLLDALAAMGWLKGEAALGIVRAALAAGTERPQEVSER